MLGKLQFSIIFVVALEVEFHKVERDSPERPCDLVTRRDHTRRECIVISNIIFLYSAPGVHNIYDIQTLQMRSALLYRRHYPIPKPTHLKYWFQNCSRTASSESGMPTEGSALVPSLDICTATEKLPNPEIFSA